ncbi:MAG: geranylgeranylglycerol-phosphate geranylgeranyltransferase [Candidatus Aenigmatarchaeota archaeon]
MVNIVGKIAGFFGLMRLFNCIIAAVTIPVIVFALTGVTGVASADVFIGTIVVFMVCGAGNALNDYFDVRADRVNKPNRPIPSRTISRNEALVFAAVLFLSAVFLSTIVSKSGFAFVVILSSALLVIYDAYSKKAGVVGNVTVSFLVAMVVVSGGIIAGSIMLSLYVALPVFLINLSRELVKSVEDMKGDSKLAKNTFPLKHGIEKTSRFASGFAAAGSIFLLNLYAHFGMIFLVLLLPALWKFSSAMLMRDKVTLAKASKISKDLKMGSVLVLVALIVASLLK